MLIPILTALFERDLYKLKTEIELYNDEEKIWSVEKSISNSAGNLCLHLVGNLNAYIGAELGKTGYVRDRPLEFSRKNVDRKELIKQIDDTLAVVRESLAHVTDEQLASVYPIKVFKEEMTTGHFLTHLATHLAYHLGQINYHRRLLDDQ